MPDESFYLQEQRLKFLKQQDQRQQQQAAEQEKLKRLKEIAENQEAKLKKVRALKGHVEQKRLSNGRLGESPLCQAARRKHAAVWSVRANLQWEEEGEAFYVESLK